MIISENQKSKVVNVDLIETFNYLLGLHIDKVQKIKNNDKNYIIITGKANSDQIVIVWRDIIGINYEQDKRFIKENLKDSNYDILYVNGSSLVKGYNSIELELKKLIYGC